MMMRNNVVRTLLPWCSALTMMLAADAWGADAPSSMTAAPSEPVVPYSIKLDPGASQRTWEGWGVSLCWWANVFGDRDDLADVCFTLNDVTLDGEKLPGLGLNIVRYNAGACSANVVDGKTMQWPPVSPKAPAFRRIEGFWVDGKSTDPASSSWDWSADARQRAMLLKARDRGANYFELFSNSPMWWMCKNLNPSGATDGSGNLDPAHYRDFAVYLATIAREAPARWGVAFTTVEAFNEASGGWWKGDGRQEGCNIPAAEQAAIIPLLREELERRGLAKTPIAASDENSYSRALKTWESFASLVQESVGQFNVHSYEDKPTSPRAEVFEAVADKRLWNSEYGNTFADGLKLAVTIGLDMQLLRPTAWCYWQVCDNPGWALIPADMVNGTLGTANPKYYVFAQYTRHIRPGMVILTSPDPGTVAAFDAKSGKLTLVTVNTGPSRAATFDLSGFADVKGPVAAWLTEPRGAARYRAGADDCVLAARCLRGDLPANSVRTFEIQGVVFLPLTK